MIDGGLVLTIVVSLLIFAAIVGAFVAVVKVLQRGRSLPTAIFLALVIFVAVSTVLGCGAWKMYDNYQKAVFNNPLTRPD